jgi:hypothetical protein
MKKLCKVWTREATVEGSE